MMRLWTAMVVLGLVVSMGRTEPNESAERGRKALLTRSFNPAVWSTQTYENVWKQWGLSEKPADFDARLRDRYGLHAAPYANDGLPMGLRKTAGLLGKGISIDCLVCHGGSIMGQSIVGLGNSTLEIQGLFEELNLAAGRSGWLPFQFTNARGTSEAGAMAVFLLGHRNPDLTLKVQRVELGLHDDMCEDPPAWWLLKKKKTMYHTGGADVRSVRSIMQFMMGTLNGPSAFAREESTFRDIREYLLAMQPPRYPFAIDQDLANQGKGLFEQTCAKCHGTYGEKWTYPNRVVKLEEIGTDPKRFEGLETPFGEYYNKSWFAQEKAGWFSSEYKALATNGYQAPPLDGVWATAPYFHNGSVPTLWNVLKSSSRPGMFTRSFRTGKKDYDAKQVGWLVQPVSKIDTNLPAIEQRKVYDTTQPGRSNRGHIYGDKLSDAQRWAVIEYLKTL